MKRDDAPAGSVSGLRVQGRFRQQTVVRERQFLAAEPVYPVDGDRQQTVGQDLDPSATSKIPQRKLEMLPGGAKHFLEVHGSQPPFVWAASPCHVEQREDPMKDAAVVIVAVHRGTLFKDLPLQALLGVVFVMTLPLTMRGAPVIV